MARKKKRDRILRIATILFASKGIRNTKIEDITNELGVAKGGLYYYFKSKDDLLNQIIEDSIKSRKEFLTDVIESSLSFEEKLKKIIFRRLELKDDRYNLFLFGKIYENGEMFLTKDDYMKKDQFLDSILDANKDKIKDEYIDSLELIKPLIVTGITKMLVLLIDKTNIKVIDEKSYEKMLEVYSKMDIEKECQLLFDIFFKNILK